MEAVSSGRSVDSRPLVEILLATYNGAVYLAELIESIQQQTYTHWHLLVSDDGSNDNSLSLIKRFAATDPRIIVLERTGHHPGAKYNFFELMLRSSADYVAFADQDDVWAPRKLEDEMDSMLRGEQQRSELVPFLVHSDLTVVDEDLAVVEPSMKSRLPIDPNDHHFIQMFLSGIVTGCTVLMNRACVNAATAQRCADKILMHDWWVGLVAEGLGRRIYLDYPLVLYRQHSGNVLGSSGPSRRLRRSLRLLGRRGPSAFLQRVRHAFLERLDQADAYLSNFSEDLDDNLRYQLQDLVSLPSLRRVSRLLFFRKFSLFERGITNRVRQVIVLLIL